jgi:hypothetical protein
VVADVALVALGNDIYRGIVQVIDVALPHALCRRNMNMVLKGSISISNLAGLGEPWKSCKSCNLKSHHSLFEGCKRKHQPSLPAFGKWLMWDERLLGEI